MQIVTIFFFLQQYNADCFDFTYFKNKHERAKENIYLSILAVK